MRRPASLVAAAALVVAAAACGGSGGDKAGGREPVERPVGKPLVLTLVTADGLSGNPTFVESVARLSRGAIRIEMRVQGAALLDYERRTIGSVLAGDFDLGSVGARVWDTLGVTSFRAIVAPLLVDSLVLQERVLESSLAERMLAGVEGADLVGIALIPGPLRRPVGRTRRLAGPGDYAGATLGIRYGGVARATVRALGATPKGYRIGSLSGLDGAELDLKTVAEVGYDTRGVRITGNVVLWARPQTIVMSRDAFDRLTAAQREILVRAGRESIASELERIAQDEADGLETICARDTASFVHASAGEVAALSEAVKPVYAELERDRETRELIAEIRNLRAGESGQDEPARCPRSRTVGSAVEASWASSVTRGDLLANGASSGEAETYQGPATLELSKGRWTFRNDRTTVDGTYVVHGRELELTMVTCTANPCSPRATARFRWSYFRRTLSLTQTPGPTQWPRLTATDWKRVS